MVRSDLICGSVYQLLIIILSIVLFYSPAVLGTETIKPISRWLLVTTPDCLLSTFVINFAKWLFTYAWGGKKKAKSVFWFQRTVCLQAWGILRTKIFNCSYPEADTVRTQVIVVHNPRILTQSWNLEFRDIVQLLNTGTVDDAKMSSLR